MRLRPGCKKNTPTIAVAITKLFCCMIIFVETYLETFNCKVLPHSLYSEYVTSSNYLLFRSKAQGLSKQHFSSYIENLHRLVNSKILIIISTQYSYHTMKTHINNGQPKTILLIKRKILFFHNKYPIIMFSLLQIDYQITILKEAVS